MTEKLFEVIKESLEDDQISRPGSILYSSYKTLTKGDVYFIGYNPGGTGGNTIKSTLDSMQDRTDNAYINEAWTNRSAAYPKGEAPFQLRVKWVIKELGYEIKNVCASNLIFFQSPKEAGVNYKKDAAKCWPVHQEILNIVQPKLIIACGNSKYSAFNFIKDKYKGEVIYTNSGHGNWKIKGFSTIINSERVFVVGFPHLSRYKPIDKNYIIKWIKENLNL